jgi:hypothetical protein
VTKVDSWPDPGGTVRVQVHYKIRSTQQAQDVALLVGA